ncbi:MAG: metal-dependent hydrolase [Polyangiaceae bacterium]|nr:metal-dependent hydrolase [Polyangiaceae bacterium]
MMPEPIEVRDLSFDLDAVPRHWHKLGRSVTTFFDTLSVFFPAGERFFVSAVRARSKHLTDPKLLDEVRRFCSQEGIHAREHVAYNEMLERQGYPVKELERGVDVILTVARRLPKSSQLAITCALEHFTALMGHALLGDPRVLEGADEEMASLWRWHAAEESEHKSVAYDVYLASGGKYPERVAMMVVASLIFWAYVFAYQGRMMATDRTARSAREWSSLFGALFVSPGGLRPLVRHYFSYYRPSFHPNDIPSRHLIDAWRARYAA